MVSKPHTSTSTASTQKCLLKGHLVKSNDSMIMLEKGTASEKGPEKKLSLSQRQCWDNKRLLVSFLYLQSLLQPQRKFKVTRWMALCPLVLEDFCLCHSHRLSPSDRSQASIEGKPQAAVCFSRPPHLPHGGSLLHEHSTA